jgi:hypothetical protein
MLHKKNGEQSRFEDLEDILIRKQGEGNALSIEANLPHIQTNSRRIYATAVGFEEQVLCSPDPNVPCSSDSKCRREDPNVMQVNALLLEIN